VNALCRPTLPLRDWTAGTGAFRCYTPQFKRLDNLPYYMWPVLVTECRNPHPAVVLAFFASCGGGQ
jgi:hypothetical protein